MSEQNVELVRRWTDAFNRDGPEGALSFLAPDIEWHDVPDQPEAAVHHGHAGFLAAFERFLAPFESFRVELDELIDRGEQVVVCARVVGQGGSSGAKFEQPGAAVFTFRAGMLARAVFFPTRKEALAAADELNQ